MRLFHRHTWSELDRKVVRGAMEEGRAFKFKAGAWSEHASDLLYGYTLVQQRCEGCGHLRTQKLTGAWPA